MKGLIVSCQAPSDSPLHDPMAIALMAHASIYQGASGVRIDSPSHIKSVRQRLPNTLIIGLWKQQIPQFDVYITPRFSDAEAVILAGADIIAIDATARPRPHGETVTNLINQIHRSGKFVMADIDTLESAINAAEAGADFVGTTLYGYTPATKYLLPPGLDLLAEMVKKLNIPVICEGGINSPAMAKKALDLGAQAVVVGTDITGIDLKVKSYLTTLYY